MVDETTPITGVQTADISTAGISSFSQNTQEVSQAGIVKAAEVVAPVIVSEAIINNGLATEAEKPESDFTERFKGKLLKVTNFGKSLIEKGREMIKSSPLLIPVKI